MSYKSINIRFLTQYRGLRYSFKRQILRGQYCAINLRIRNDIAALILAEIVTLSSWDLVSSDIAEDIVNLLPAIESGTTKIWMESVKFSDNDEDVFFKKTLLMIIAHLADIDVYVFVKYSYQFYFLFWVVLNKREITKKYKRLNLLFLNITFLSFNNLKVSFTKKRKLFLNFRNISTF